MNAVFLNIFGGILRCDKLALSVIKASEEIPTTKPIVLRLKGTNSAEARKLIEGKEEELGIFFSEDIDEGARMVVKLAS